MIEQRARRSPATYREALVWSEKPAVWVALALGALLVSVPLWIDGVTGDKPLGFVAGGAFTVTAVMCALYARHLVRNHRRD